jgi:hypothetical protein
MSTSFGRQITCCERRVWGLLVQAGSARGKGVAIYRGRLQTAARHGILLARAGGPSLALGPSSILFVLQYC